MNDGRARSRWVLLGQTRPCPFAVEGAEEPFDLAVPAWCARRDEDVPGIESGERVTKLEAGGVALRVVAHDRLDGSAALFAHPDSGAPERGRDRRGVLGRVDLAVDQAGVVIDDPDHLD